MADFPDSLSFQFSFRETFPNIRVAAEIAEDTVKFKKILNNISEAMRDRASDAERRLQS
jgi:hypothetical protein